MKPLYISMHIFQLLPYLENKPGTNLSFSQALYGIILIEKNISELFLLLCLFLTLSAFTEGLEHPHYMVLQIKIPCLSFAKAVAVRQI